MKSRYYLVQSRQEEHVQGNIQLVCCLFILQLTLVAERAQIKIKTRPSIMSEIITLELVAVRMEN